LLTEKVFQAIDEYCKARDFKNKDSLYKAIQSGLLLAYRKTYNGADNCDVIVDEKTKIFRIIERKIIVVRVKDKITQISLNEALIIKPDCHIGDFLDVEVSPSDFDRIAADVVKQVVLQKIHDAEIDSLFDEYKAREYEMVLGEISKITRPRIYINLGKVEGILLEEEKIRNEEYRVGSKIHCLIFSVQKRQREVLILLSRTHPQLLKKLMELEIPELKQGIIEARNIVREPGIRAKIAVFSKEEKIDAVGTCIGAKGSRINAVGKHLNNEKIDVIRWSEDPRYYIANSLSPAKVPAANVHLDPERKVAKVIVDQSFFSLAIGKEGLNVKLAARLTGYKLDVSVNDPSNTTS
jgi:N utilization substance protein A